MFRKDIFFETVQSLNGKRIFERVKISIFIYSSFASLGIGIWMLIDEILFGLFFVTVLFPCLLIYPLIRGIFFGGKDSAAAVVTTVIVEEVTKAGIRYAVDKHQKKKSNRW